MNPPRSGGRHRWPWLLALFVVAVAIALTVLLHHRVELANRWLPTLAGAYLPAEIEQLQFSAIGFGETRIGRLDLRWRRDDHELTLALTGARLRYRPLARRIDAVFADSAHLRGDLRALPETTGAEPAGFAPPLVPIGIDRLNIDVATPYGPLAVAGQVSFDLRDDRFLASFGQPEYRIELDGRSQGGALNIRLLDAGGGEPVVAARLQPDGQRLGRLSGHARLARLLDLLRRSGQFPDLVARLEGTALRSGPVDFDLTGLSPLELTLDGRFDGLTVRDYRITADFQARLSGTERGHRVALAANRGVRIEAVRQGDRGDIETVQLNPEPDIGVDATRNADGQLTVTLRNAVPVRVKRVGLPPAEARLSRLRVTAHRRVDFDMQLDAIRVPEFDLSVTSLTTVGHADGGNLRGQSRINGIRSSRLANRLASYTTGVDWRLDDGRFTASGRAQAEQWPSVDWRLVNRGRQGELRASWREPAARLTPLMRQLVAPLAERFTLTSGNVLGDLVIGWQGKRESSRLDVRIDDVGAEIWGVALSSLNARLSSDDVLNGRLRVAAELKSAALGIGAELRDTRFEAAGDLDRLELEELSFKALDGNVRLQPTELRFDDDRQKLTLDIEDIDLGELLRTLDIAGLSGAGRLSGTIPLQLSGDRWSIVDGTLRSLVPGRFSYRVGNSEPALDNIALAALRDFRFDSLRVGVDYDVGGDYRLRARIVGRNPAVLDGRLLALNPNIEGRLPGLLLAILLGDFDAAMLQRLTREGAGNADSPATDAPPPGTDAGR